MLLLHALSRLVLQAHLRWTMRLSETLFQVAPLLTGRAITL